MLFHVTMTVRIPHDADPERIKLLSGQEHERAPQQARCYARNLWHPIRNHNRDSNKWEMLCADRLTRNFERINSEH
jgi:muconolactone delta-isomerase